MSSFHESFILSAIKIFSAFIRILPAFAALFIGRLMGTLAYYFDTKHKSQAYANLKMAFSSTRSPEVIKQITKELFHNYGQSLIELLRMPLLDRSKFEDLVKIDGRENVTEALKQGKGVILLAMHFGSWELASLTCAMLDYPYKVIVKPQSKYSQLDELLNSYRSCRGSVVLSRGMGTRDLIKSLQNNEVIGMVVDQGGRDGVLVPFFGREASMSVGAIRLALKFGVPICFSIIIRESSTHHRMIIHPPMAIDNTGDVDRDVVSNLKKVTRLMEDYVTKYPSEYMWFYKIWKYSKETNLTILSDGKTGHLRQSESTAFQLQKALDERGVRSFLKTIRVAYRGEWARRIFSILSFFMHPSFCQGRLEFLKIFLTEESFRQLMSSKSDFIISTGSSVAAVNYLLSRDHNAKSIAILKPGILGFRRFDRVILPQHDVTARRKRHKNLIVTHAAPNVITPGYLKVQSESLLTRFSHLKAKVKPKIGVFIGGNTKNVDLSESMMKVVIQQLKEAAEQMNADIMITTSRRTSKSLEQMLRKAFKKDPRCILLILANEENVPEAVGGIMGLSDILVVSGDSVSMVSEAANSGKPTLVFSPRYRELVLKKMNKHRNIVEGLSKQGYVHAIDANFLAGAISDVAKGKITTKKLDDNEILFDAMRYVI
jgi:KDO2-lipid IV(A) lauroyltransferase